MDSKPEGLIPGIQKESLQPLYPSTSNTQPVFKFVGFALLFNTLFYLLALFVQIRGWVDVGASYIVLGIMWLVGTAISWALAVHLKLRKTRVSIVVSSIVWAAALVGLNAWAPKTTPSITEVPTQSAVVQPSPTPDEIAAEIAKRIPKQQARAWLQVVDASNPTPHTVKLKIKNFGQIPAFDTRLTKSFEIDRFDNGMEALNIDLATLSYNQTASGGEFSIDLNTNIPQVLRVLDENRPKGNFSIRVHGRVEYRDTETSEPHLLKVCYSDLGFAVTVNNITPMFECTETGLNISK